jgi:flagellar assembly protein FliH
MGLIKSADAPTKLVAFSMKDIETAARAILVRAQQKAEQVLVAARTEAEMLKLQAHERGFIEGKGTGLEQGLQEGKKSGHDQALAENSAALTQLIQSLSTASGIFETSRDDLQNQGLVEVVHLACAIARRVTKRQGMIDPAVLTENLKDAMAMVSHAADVRVAVNPAQLQTLQAELPNLRLAWPQLKHIELTEDASISPGGARIFTTHGQVDADLDTQLDRVIAELSPQAGIAAPNNSVAPPEASPCT